MKALHLTSFCSAAALAFTINVSAQTGAQQGTSGTTATPPQSSGAQSETSTTTAGAQQSSSSDRVVTFVGCVQKETAALGTSGIGTGNEYVLTDARMGSADTASASSTSSAGAPSAVGTSGSESAVPGSETAPADSASEGDAGELDTKMDAPEAADDATASAERNATSTGAVGTSGSMSAASHGKIYELTGTREGDMARFVGKRVEITGKLEHGASAVSSGSASATPAGQAGDSDRTDDSDQSSAGQSADASASQPPRAAAAGEIDITDVREIGGDCSSPVSR